MSREFIIGLSALFLVAACERSPGPGPAPGATKSKTATAEESSGFSSRDLQQLGVRVSKRPTIDFKSILMSVPTPQKAPGGIDLGPLSTEERSSVEEEKRASEDGSGEEIGGIVRELSSPLAVNGIPTPKAEGEQRYLGGTVSRSADGKDVSWRIAFESGDASAVRLHLTGVALPNGTRVFVSDGQEQAFGPYFTPARGDDPQDFWTHEIDGNRIYLEVLVPLGSDLSSVRLTIDELGHMIDDSDDEDDNPTMEAQPGAVIGAMLEAPERTLRVAAKSPYVDVACMSKADLDPVREALNADAHISYHKAPNSRYFGLCSAALISDKKPNGKPSGTLYLLTAYHCVNTEYKAKHLTAYWKYRRAACGGRVPRKRTLEQNLGATLLEKRRENDFSFILLKGPAPRDAYWLGWSSEPAPIGTILHRIHHPRAYSQKYQKSEVDNRKGCKDRPQSEYHYSKRLRGSTYKGSSGSVVFSVRSPVPPGRKKLQAQGQLWGWCNGRNVDGEFNRTYPHIKKWLLPSE